MRIDIFHHFMPDSMVLSRLDDIEDKMDLILEKETTIMSLETDALDQAEAAAKANSAADDSAEQLLVTISKMVADLKANASDPTTIARITALATAISSRAAQLGAAVVTNTPAAPPPTT